MKFKCGDAYPLSIELSTPTPHDRKKKFDYFPTLKL